MTCSTTTLSTYDAEDVVQILGAFRDAAGDFVIPPGVEFRITSPLGETATLVYETDDAVENGTFEDSAGVEYNFRASVQPIELEEDEPAGKWTYKWVGIDDGTAVQDRVAGAEEGAFLVRESDVG